MRESDNKKIRKIIHIDMDAFYASVEQRDSPDIRGKPVIVGGKPGSRGVVAACSYEARQFGIHSAMPCSRAFRLCNEAVFVRPRFEVYRAVSTQIHEVFQHYTTIVEPLSLDEAYLDVTDCKQCSGSATLIAEAIRSEILESTKLTASAGVSYNKFLAKIASDLNKPNGIAVIRPHEGEDFVAELPIGKFYGVGKVTEKRMHEIGIKTGSDLRKMSLDELKVRFGKAADYYYAVARAVDNRPVSNSRERKSIGSETTFAQDMIDSVEMLVILNQLAGKVLDSLTQKKMLARTLTIKVKYSDFKQVSRSHTFENTLTEPLLQKWLSVLLDKTEANEKPVRLLGVSVSQLTAEDENTIQELLI